MRSYNHIPYWENKKRTQILSEFRQLVEEYYANLRHTNLGDTIVTTNAEAIRRKINYILDKAHRIILLSGVSPKIYYSPPPAIGGLAGNIDLIINLFHLHDFQIGRREVLDVIDRAIGIYIENKKRSIVRTFNPFYWIGCLFYYVSLVPFILVGKAGFNRSKFEKSSIGKTLKFIIYIAEAFVAFIAIIEILKRSDYFENLKLLIKSLIMEYL